jgi:hypothetical protein
LIRLSASAFDILWSDLGHSRVPGPLCVPSVGATEAERAVIRRSVYDNLAERGLFGEGRLDPALEERLDLLASASVTVECEAMIDFADPQPLRCVAAATGGAAVLAAQPKQTIGLSALGAGDLVAAAVGVLPELEPGPGYGVSLPAAALGADVADPMFETGGDGRSRAFEQQIREVLAIQARPVLAAGQFSVRLGSGARSSRIGGVSWFVTDVGAYLGAREPGRAGQDWVSVAPADNGRLAARVAALLDH